jgi:hypothetical protein
MCRGLFRKGSRHTTAKRATRTRVLARVRDAGFDGEGLAESPATKLV